MSIFNLVPVLQMQERPMQLRRDLWQFARACVDRVSAWRGDELLSKWIASSTQVVCMSVRGLIVDVTLPVSHLYRIER